MTIKQKSDYLREIIKNLKKQGYQYRIFWTIAEMKNTNFYHYIHGKTTLKQNEIERLEKYLKENFQIEI